MIKVRKFNPCPSPNPQPRRHKCENCSSIFVCADCTNAMLQQNNSYDYPLYADYHSPGHSRERFLCSQCLNQPTVTLFTIVKSSGSVAHAGKRVHQ